MKLTKKKMAIRAQILDKIYTMGPISRIDIAHQTGITPATVTEFTGILIEEGLIHEEGIEESNGGQSGRKKILLDISHDYSYIVGVELSEKYISFCLTDNLGKIIAKKIITFHDWHVTEQLTEQEFILQIRKFINNQEHVNISAIGVALPGHYEYSRETIVSNHPFWKQFNIAKITNSFTIPVYFANNVECMAITQRIFSHEQKDRNFIFLHVARGMFCSYMYDGQIYGKDNFLVGEIGFTVVQPDGDLFEQGKYSYLQNYASETAIIKKAQILYENSKSTYLRQLVAKKSDIHITEVLQAYRLGDEGVVKILRKAIKYLAIILKNLSLLIDSRIIYIHGELFGEPDLFESLREQIIGEASFLLPEGGQQVLLAPYHNVDGAQAACGLVVYNTFLIDAK